MLAVSLFEAATGNHQVMCLYGYVYLNECKYASGLKP